MAKKMLKSHHLAILALVLALGIATPIFVASLSEDEAARAADETNPEEGESSTPDTTVTETPDTPAPENTSVTVGTLTELKSALEDPAKSTITLSADIELSESLNISRDLTLDLATHKITVAEGVRSAFNIRQGDVKITGSEGSITIGSGVAVWVYGSKVAADTDFTHLTITKGVTLVASTTNDASYGIAVNRYDESNNVAYGVKVDFNGEINAYNGITILGYIQHSDNNAPIINIGDDAAITAKGIDDSMAIYAAGYGIWTVGAANLTGSSALGTKAGQFTFTGTTMTANGTHHDDVATANGSIAGSGATFQIEDNAVYAGGVQITIDGGQYSSANSNVFYEYSSAARANSGPLQKLIVKSGTFTAGTEGSIFSGVNVEAVNLTGGSYNKEFSAEYLGTNQKLVAENGVWTIQASSPSENPPSTNPDPDDENNDTEQKPNDKPQTEPDKDAPGTGVHNITSHISAIATATSAVIAGVLVFCALILRRLIHRRPDQSKTQPQSTSSRTKPSTAKSASKSTKTTTKSATTKPKSAKTKKQPSAQPSKAKSAKSTKSSAKSSTKKGTKTSKARK